MFNQTFHWQVQNWSANVIGELGICAFLQTVLDFDVFFLLTECP